MRLPTFHKLFLLVMSGVFVCLSITSIHPQEPIGGPYEPDSATVLLMHFDGDFTNASNFYNLAAPRSYEKVSYLDMEGGDSLGQQLSIDYENVNEPVPQVADTAALDLTDSWTLQVWINIFSYGSLTWTVTPRGILGKPLKRQNRMQDRHNYFLRYNGSTHQIETGFWGSSGQKVMVAADGPYVGQWTQVTAFNDADRHMLGIMVHTPPEDEFTTDTAALTLQSQNLRYYDPSDTGQPVTSDSALTLATTLTHLPYDSLDVPFDAFTGFLDELRISNVVRHYKTPPDIKQVTQYHNQPPDKSYPVETRIINYGSNSIGKVILHYQVDSAGWNQMTMYQSGEENYRANLLGLMESRQC